MQSSIKLKYFQYTCGYLFEGYLFGKGSRLKYCQVVAEIGKPKIKFKFSFSHCLYKFSMSTHNLHIIEII